MDMDLINELEVSRTISVKYLDRTLRAFYEIKRTRKATLPEPVHVWQVSQEEGTRVMTHH